MIFGDSTLGRSEMRWSRQIQASSVLAESFLSNCCVECVETLPSIVEKSVISQIYDTYISSNLQLNRSTRLHSTSAHFSHGHRLVDEGWSASTDVEIMFLETLWQTVTFDCTRGWPVSATYHLLGSLESIMSFP